MAHTIVMYQPTKQLASRTFSDYETSAEAMDGLCAMFQMRLAQQRPGDQAIEYDIADLFEFLESFEDFSMLQFNPAKRGYEPFGLASIKHKLYSHLKAQ